MAKGNGGGNAEGITVGRISIKVSPDTKKFRSDLKEELEAIEREVKGTVHVEAEAETAKAEKKLDATAKDRTAKVKVVVADKGWQQKFLDRAREMRVNTVPNASNENERARLRGVLDEMKRMGPGIGTSIDAKVLKAKWNATLNEIEADLKRKKLKLDVEVNEKKIVREVVEAVDKANGKASSVGGGRGRDGGGGGGGGGGGRNNVGVGGSFGMPNLWPNFGSGINPAGYVAILGAVALVAAPLIGLVSTLVLAIPGMISAIATPFMAISLGLDGIKKAAAGSGLFSLDDKGEIDGMGKVFDNVKAKVSAAFEGGLDQPLKDIAAAIDPLLGSLPKVATGLTDMFKGFTDSLTSPKGMELFDDTIAKIGQAMTMAAPGVQRFTDGMIGIANTFANQLPGLSTWFTKTGDDFAKWVDKMNTPTWDGRTPMGEAFKGLGGTLETIGNWVIDMSKAGMEFVSDPNKMKDFIATLKNIGDIITNLVDMGNDLTAVWRNLGMLPAMNKGQQEAEANKLIESTKPPKPEDAPPVDDRNWLEKTIGSFFDGSKGPGTRFFEELFPKSPEEIKSDIAGVTQEIATLESAVRERMATSALAPSDDPAQSNYAARLTKLRADLAELKALEAELQPQVALRSLETPLPTTGADGYSAGNSAVSQIIADLEKVPPAAQTAKDALQQVQDTGALTPNALGALSDAAQNSEPVKIPEPDTASLEKLPEAATTAMQGVNEQITAGGAQAASAAVVAGAQIYNGFAQTVPLFSAVGIQMMAGLAQGITNGQSMAIAADVNAAKAALQAAKDALDINSPSKKFIKVGESTGEGMAIGLQNGFGPVLDQSADLSSKIADAFNSGADPTGFLEGFSKQETSRMEKVLNVQSRILGRQASSLEKQFKATKNQSFKDQADAIRSQMDDIAERKDYLDLAQDFAELQNGDESDWKGPIAKIMNSVAKMPTEFLGAVGDQAMQDLNISGGGLMGAVMDYGNELGNKFIFNVGNMEDALTAQQRMVQRQNMGVNPR